MTQRIATIELGDPKIQEEIDRAVREFNEAYRKAVSDLVQHAIDHGLSPYVADLGGKAWVFVGDDVAYGTVRVKSDPMDRQTSIVTTIGPEPTPATYAWLTPIHDISRITTTEPPTRPR
jgi:hypothetical protein